MILKQVNFNGLVVPHYQIKNNKCYYFKDGKTITFQYRVADIPDYYVAGEGLYMDSSTTTVDTDNNLVLNSLRIFSVKNNTLTIKEE